MKTRRARQFIERVLQAAKREMEAIAEQGLTILPSRIIDRATTKGCGAASRQYRSFGGVPWL